MQAKYELVLQFALAPRDVAQFERVARLEEDLARPSMLYTLEGHDCTTGQMDVVLLTDDPLRSFELVQTLIPRACSYRAAYRNLQTGEPLTALAAAPA